MSLEPDFLKQLVLTFSAELDEKLQVMSDSLLALEKNPADNVSILEEIFRAAHNIKGSARSLGIQNISKIAHHIESLFADIRKSARTINPDIINLCLSAVDAMHSAMRAYCDNKPLDFDLEQLVNRLEHNSNTNTVEQPKPQPQSQPVIDNPQAVTKITNSPHSLSLSLSAANYDSIRVSSQQINTISALVEELQIKKLTVEDLYIELGALATKAQHLKKALHPTAEQIHDLSSIIDRMRIEMRTCLNELHHVSSSLQEEVSIIHLVPASTLLRHLTRSIRELAAELNKKIEFEVIGDQVKMDKMILEGLKDPIIHILRNAIDHGIESPDIRLKHGKTEAGIIRIHVIDEGNQIAINISDNGAGIDYLKIAEYAEKKHLASRADLGNLSPAEIIDLIFRPEFSTKDIVTDVSGRGVGLDVVKANILNLKGTVSISTELGEGTTFHLRVPLTLSSDKGLIIKCAQQLFVIPTHTIDRVLIIQAQQIITVENTQVIIIDHKTIPITKLTNLLSLQVEDSSFDSFFSVVILEKSHDRIAIIVDEIVGERDIVIKPLQFPLSHITGLTGGTLAGNGDVIIVLNPSDLLNLALHSKHKACVNINTQHLEQQTKPHILLVDDSLTTRTLEKNILENNNYQVSLAVDGKQAWEFVQQQPFSLIITDIEMPNMTGLELTERVKSNERTRNTPIIIVSSLESIEHKKQGIEAGADAYIVKHDFDSTELLQVVRQLV